MATTTPWLSWTTSLSGLKPILFPTKRHQQLQVLVQHWISRFGVPLQLHSDQGRNFDSAVCKRLCEILAIDKTRTTALHPQSDGMVERSAVHETTGYSPSQMLFGRDLRLPADLLFSRPPDAPLAPEEYIEKLQARMEEMHHLARERIGMASEKMKTRYDARATEHDFHEGDKVWLWNRKRRKGLSPKLQMNWEGPYTVLKRLNDVVVRVQKSPHSKPKESPVNTSRETFFFPEFDLNKFSSLKSFLECFDKQCLEYQKDEQWKKQNIPRYLTGVYLKFWYENHLFEKSYQEIKQLLMTVFDATKQEDIRKFQNLTLNDTKELISFFTEKLSLGKKLNYDDSSIVEHMTLSIPLEFQKFLVIKKISTPCEWISTMRQLIAVTPDSADRKPVDTGSYTRWNHAYGSVHRGTDAQNRFQSRGNHGQPHQSHMMRFSGNQQYNSQPRQFVQQNRHNLYSPRNENNQRQG
ncbi:retrovirus-related Pol polyprotein from transposon 412 [Trichonephila clavipes]|nr:retrovirus-related Pol polyprotein from transposon 412 [Trichonephila clavipes]